MHMHAHQLRLCHLHERVGAMVQAPLTSLASLDSNASLLRRPPRGPIGPNMPANIAPARVSRFGAPGSRLPTHSSF